MTLVDFLKARLDEDEVAATKASEFSAVWAETGTWCLDDMRHTVVGDGEAYCGPHNAEHIARHDPARVLCEVEAKRMIVRAHEKWCKGACETTSRGGETYDAAHWWALKALAIAYANHSDYREEWRPA
ncbi:DUF6221 family protein [Actinocorallia sp. API 0066]|uniref:DUF6221 family protein n=1 Tax=Actinocorallia sp. API 0066 TaxID=2896846 RepID=UPI001E4DCF94|nr:DUF6221 family protein [Actinocorallia sp. API 0066]MCD0450782.1 DUF6221 family protein [Actinocorallia sp. API 0066]